MTRGKRISFLFLCFSIGLAAFVCLDFYRRQKSPLYRRFEAQWARDVQHLEASGKLPAAWNQIKEIEVIGGTPETKAWLKRIAVPLKTNPEGTNKLEVLVVVWEENGKRGVLIQYNIEDLKTRNMLGEIGRTLILSTPSMESPMQALLEGLKTMIRVLGLAIALLTVSCTSQRAELGTADNPVKFYFVPSVDVKLLEDTSKVLKAYLEKTTPYVYKIAIPPSYIAVVEAFGTKRADVASLNPYGYVLAYEKYGAQARLVTVRYGETTYQAQFLAKAGGSINKLEDLAGKKLAFVDPSSVSGYLLPMKFLKDRGIKPKETMFAMRHDTVISMIYQGQVDAGATFYSPPEKGEIQDARRLLLAQYPDVEKKIKIVTLTTSIPNDPIVFRKDMLEDMKEKITLALIAFAKTPEGLESLKKLSSITGLAPTTDAYYDGTRAMIKELGNVDAELKK